MLPEFRWENSLANIRLHGFAFYVEAGVAFWGLLCLQRRQGEFSISPSLWKYIILVFASFRTFFICTLTLPKILLSLKCTHRECDKSQQTKNITNSILIQEPQMLPLFVRCHQSLLLLLIFLQTPDPTSGRRLSLPLHLSPDPTQKWPGRTRPSWLSSLYLLHFSVSLMSILDGEGSLFYSTET